MSAPAAQRVGRFYTAARRHPWVLGKVADWRLPLGPYTPAQIAVAVIGGFLLVKTIPLWSWMGPVPLVAWLLAVWLVRRQKIGGRAPLPAVLGWSMLLWQPTGGRIAGRAARDRQPSPLLGGFTLEAAPALRQPVAVQAPPRPAPPAKRRRPPATAPHRSTAPRATVPVTRTRRDKQAASASAAGAAPVSGVQQLLALAVQRSGGVR